MKDKEDIFDVANRLNRHRHALLEAIINIKQELHLSGLQNHAAYKLAEKATKEILYETPDATTDNDRQS